MTATGAFSAVATKSGLKSKDVKAVIVTYMELAASELKKNGTFKIGGWLKLKLKKTPARPVRKGVSRITKEPCIFYDSPAYNTVRAEPLKKLLGKINAA